MLTPMSGEKALVILSGGQDSTTCLALAASLFDEVHTVTFNYGQRHNLEIDYAVKNARFFNAKTVTLLNMDLLNQLAPNALTRDDIAIEEGKDGHLPSTFVDGRNMVFLTFAAIHAKQLGIKHLVTGVCQTDFSGYPDCRDQFIKSLNVTLNLAMDYEFVIHTPLMWLDKTQTWALADELGAFDVIRHNTVTCYNGIPGDGCGECPSCKLRNKGLQKYVETSAREF